MRSGRAFSSAPSGFVCEDVEHAVPVAAAASAAVARSVPLKNVRLLIAMSASRFADTLFRPYYPLYV